MKIDSNSVIIRFANLMQRLLRLNKSSTITIISLIEEDQETFSESYQKEIRNGIIQADYINAQGIMVIQNRRYY